jgi:hypothetical protein
MNGTQQEVDLEALNRNKDKAKRSHAGRLQAAYPASCKLISGLIESRQAVQRRERTGRIDPAAESGRFAAAAMLMPRFLLRATAYNTNPPA